MASSASDLLKLELQATGDNNNSWGTTANTLFARMEESIAGISTNSTDANWTLDDTQYVQNSGATAESHQAVLKFSAALSANRNIIVPDRTKLYLLHNATSNAFTVTIKTSGGTGPTIAQGAVVWVYCDGTNVVEVIDPTTHPEAGIKFAFESTTTDTDQGVGKVWLNNATPSSATVLYFDDVEAGGVSVNAWADALDNATGTIRGTLYIAKYGSSNNLLIFNVTGAVTSASTYSKVAVTHVLTVGTISDGDNVGVVFTPGANDGTMNGPGSSTDNAIARYNGTGGVTLQDSGVTVDDNDLLSAPGGVAFDKGGDITSASPLVIDIDGGMFDVTGTTSFTTMTVAAKRLFILQFDGALTMTHGAGTLDLPNGVNITTAAGDHGLFYATAANVVRCISFEKVDATASATVEGLVELATDAELATGTDTARAVTPANVESLIIGKTEVVVAAADSILFEDATDSALKRDTVQGILDLVPASAAGWTVVAAAVADADTAVVFEDLLTSTYDVYCLVVNNVDSSANGQEARLVLGTSGSTYVTNSWYHQASREMTDTTGDADLQSTGRADIELTGQFDLGTTVAARFNSVIYIFNPADSACGTHIGFSSHFMNDNPRAGYVRGTGYLDGDGDGDPGAAHASVKIVIADAGNFITGNFVLYGLAKS
tara:strand:+ start:5385 stop:7367 length:1983 start_codon:yes stop_codon:yes gene_type:complete